jgi:hypothetical protein
MLGYLLAGPVGCGGGCAAGRRGEVVELTCCCGAGAAEPGGRPMPSAPAPWAGAAPLLPPCLACGWLLVGRRGRLAPTRSRHRERDEASAAPHRLLPPPIIRPGSLRRHPFHKLSLRRRILFCVLHITSCLLLACCARSDPPEPAWPMPHRLPLRCLRLSRSQNSLLLRKQRSLLELMQQAPRPQPVLAT